MNRDWIKPRIKVFNFYFFIEKFIELEDVKAHEDGIFR